MIKRIRFATRHGSVAADEFRTGWLAAAEARAVSPPPDARPVRATTCLALPEVLAEPEHDAISLEWFDDDAHLARAQAWERGEGLPDTTGVLAGLVDLATSPTVVAEEAVLRGSDWLDDRWRRGGACLKHMAIARRAPGLTPAEFRERWQGRAGVLKGPGSSGTTPIPDEARGSAYVQNHPLLDHDGDWAYDAINEVYVEDLGGLRRRIDWLAANLREGAEDDLVGRHRFLAVVEEVLPLPPLPRPTA